MARDFGNTKSNARSSSMASSRGGDPNVLGRGVRIRGRLSGEGDLRIDGEIDGDVKVGGSLELGQTATVSGNLTAKSVVIDGSLTGDVESQGPVVIRSSARVAGNMSGSEIALEEGAAFSGRIEADFELPDGLMAGGGGPAGRRGR